MTLNFSTFDRRKNMTHDSDEIDVEVEERRSRARKTILGIGEKVEYIMYEIGSSDKLLDSLYGEEGKIVEMLDVLDMQLDIACKAIKIGLAGTIFSTMSDFLKKGSKNGK